ncbi:MAG TPA: molybdopterin cofactor-binding domain-containing protein [Candidatus Limnocylindria bacterium]|jgi:CO/xanthine dehydrogenase Mo-binding subunit
MSGSGERTPERVEQRIRIEPDGTVVALSGKTEFGQGIRTAFAQVVADEMNVPIERVRVVLGDTDQVPWDMGTFGSRSVAQEAPALRRAAAYARALLARGAKVEGAIPSDVRLRPDTDRRYVGRPLPRVEAREIVTGEARFVADVRLPNMVYGAIVRPPSRGANVRTLDGAAARSMPGVVAIVRQGDVVGAVAEREDQAHAAADAIEVTWTAYPLGQGDGLVLPMRDDPGVDDAMSRGATRLSAEYTLPPISNAPIGPSAAVADVRADAATIYAGTQRPFGLRAEVAATLGLDEKRVRVVPQMPSGTYGRNSSADAPIEAAILSKAAGRPVHLQWTRAEEFAFAPNRPPAHLAIAAALDAQGRIAAWTYDEHTNAHTGGGIDPSFAAMTSGRNAIPHYRLGKARVTLHVDPTPLRTASFRSLAAAENVFAIESFMDELAHASGQEPLAFRLAHVEDDRLRRVYERVAAMSAWGRASEARRGLGIAGTIYHGTYIAEVAEVEVAQSGRVQVIGVWAAIDPGRTLNPDGVRNQTEGGIQQSTSWTLLEELRHRDGRIANFGWDTYPIATFRDAPSTIEVDVIGDPTKPSTGVGEPGAVAISAAIGNAVFAAVGVRVRELPMTPERVRGRTER